MRLGRTLNDENRAEHNRLWSGAGRRFFCNGASSPQMSLTWTSIRTLNCCPRCGEHAEQTVFPADVPRPPAIRRMAMDLIFSSVAGLDVHQKSIVACIRKVQPQGG